MLSDIVSAIETACDSENLNKEFLFGTIAEDMNNPSKAYSELVFLQIPFSGSASQDLLRHGSGQIGYTLDLYVFEKYNDAQRQATTKQAAWDTAMNSLISVVNKACELDRNLQRSLTGQQSHNEILRFGNAQYISVRMTLNFTNYWKC